MKYNEWRDELKSNLLGVAESERQRVLDYYAEAYADRREAGFNEREIIEEFGAPYDAAQRILAETPKAEREAAPEKAPAPSPSPAPASQPAPTLPVAAYVAQQTAAPAPAQTKKKSNTGLIVGLVCGFIGLIIIVLAITLPILAVKGMLRSRIVFTTEIHTATEDDTALNVSINAGSLKTEFYDGDKIVIEYPVSDRYDVSITEESGVLTYTAQIKRIPFWTSYSIPDTVIKIPNGTVVDITAKMNAGSAYLTAGKYNDLNLEVDAGELSTAEIECTALSAKVAAGSFYAKQITCPSLTCEVNMGELAIKKLTCDSIKAEVNMGSAEIGMTGAKSSYNISASCDMGSSNVSNQTVAGSDKRIEIEVNMGSIEVTFDK